MNSPRAAIQFKLHPLLSPVQLLVGVIELIHSLFALIAVEASQTFLITFGVGPVNPKGIFLLGLFFAALGAHNVHDAFAATNHTGLICQLGTFLTLGIAITLLETHKIPLFFLLPAILLVLTKYEQMKSISGDTSSVPRRRSTRKRKEEKEEKELEVEELEVEEVEEDDTEEEEELPRRSSRKHKSPNTIDKEE
jgi:hypothetical protein